MKKTLLSLTLILAAVIVASAQCKLEQDSITAGNGVSEHQNYYYDAQDRLTKVTRIDSGQTTFFSYDSLFYNVTTGYLEAVYLVDASNSIPRDTTVFTYNGSGQITRIDARGDDGGYWAMSHDVVYSGTDMTDINLDQTSVVGSPEGLIGSFKNITWSGGNLLNVDLVADMGAGPITLELSATYDTKNNIQKHFVLSEAGDLLFRYSKNNIISLTLDNNVPPLGNIGDKAIDHTYTYTSDDEVETLIENPSIFESESTTRRFKYDCVTSVEDVINEKDLIIYPNPVVDRLNISQYGGIGHISILNITGKVIYSENTNANNYSINTSGYSRGVYFVKIESERSIDTYKFIKK